MLPFNSRIIVGSFDNVVIPAQSKKQLEMQVDVIAPGQTSVSAIITDPDDDTEIVPEAILTLNSRVIDSRVTLFTTGAAIILLLAAVAQSVRRVRRRVK
jgi:glycine cleavage system regulatory protein